jgi:hypothetical protein
MIDTITVIIKNYKYNEISNLIDSFKNVNLKYRDNGTLTKTGQHKNFLFFLTENCFTITGSITKLIKGSNQMNYTIEVVQESIKYLSHLLRMDISKAKIIRLDFGLNIKLDYPVFNYLSMLIKPTLTKKHIVENQKGKETVEYRSWDRKAIFYDKIAELKATGIQLDAKNQNCNLLRYEIKFNSRISHRFNVAEVTFEMLAEVWFYQKLLQTWYEQYSKILKVYKPVPVLDFSMPKNFKATLVAYGIHAVGGAEFLLRAINNDPKAKKYSGRLRKTVKENCVSFGEIDFEPLLRELDDKIYFLSHPID